MRAPWHCHRVHKVLAQPRAGMVLGGYSVLAGVGRLFSQNFMCSCVLSPALPRNIVCARTSVIVRAQKIINGTDKTSEQIDPRQKDRGDVSCQLGKHPAICRLAGEQLQCFQNKEKGDRKPLEKH